MIPCGATVKCVCLLMLAGVRMSAADATGEWKGTLAMVTPNGTALPSPAYLTLKQEGANLTGSGGPNASTQQPIKNGKTENGNVMFEAPAVGRNSTMKFVLRHDGDVLEGNVTAEMNGQTLTMKAVLKRERSAAASPSIATQMREAAQPSIEVPQQNQQLRRSSIQGVWRVVEEKNTWRIISDPNPGYIIYTDKYFAVVREAQDIKRPEVTDFDKATPEQLVAMWGPFVAQFGTYDIERDVLTKRILVSKNKAKMGQAEVERLIFKLDGNTLTTEPFRDTDGMPQAKPIGLKLVRVE